jgi:hypothetical protein
MISKRNVAERNFSVRAMFLAGPDIEWTVACRGKAGGSSASGG